MKSGPQAPTRKRAPRLFFAEAAAGKLFVAKPRVVSHCRALKLAAGDAATLSNGAGLDFPARIEKLSGKGVAFSVGAPRENSRESPRRVTLIVALPKRAAAAEALFAAGTEMGAAAFWPIAAERGGEAPPAAGRLSGIVESAAAVAERGALPELAPLQPFEKAIESAKKAGGAAVVLDSFSEDAPLLSLAPQLPSAGRLFVLVGPEGGFSAAEVAAARAAGFTGARLGPRILRVETAAAASLAILLTAA